MPETATGTPETAVAMVGGGALFKRPETRSLMSVGGGAVTTGAPEMAVTAAKRG